MKKSILIFLLIFSTTFSFHIAPTFFEQRIDGGGGYQEFTLINNSDKTQRFKVTPLPGSSKYQGDMDKWIETAPKVITVKPQSSSVLKVFIKAPKDTPIGEYSSFLNFKSIPVPDLAEKKEGTITPTTVIGLSVNVEIIGYVGESIPKLKIENLKIDEDKNGNAIVTFKVKNNTENRGVWYNIDILKNSDDFETTEKGRVKVGQTDDIKIIANNIKKREISGVRLVESTSQKEITKEEL